MLPGELETLIGLIADREPLSMLEIGVNTGRTAAEILDNVPSLETYQGVDVLPGYRTEKFVQRREVPQAPGHLASHDKRFELVLRARGSLDLQPSELLPADVVFIDGDHSRRCVSLDTALAHAVVKPGGLIIWHDYHDLGTVDVRDVLDEWWKAGEAITHIEGTWLAFKQIPKRQKRVAQINQLHSTEAVPETV